MEAAAEGAEQQPRLAYVAKETKHALICSLCCAARLCQTLCPLCPTVPCVRLRFAPGECRSYIHVVGARLSTRFESNR